MNEDAAKLYTRVIEVFARVDLREAVKVEIGALLMDYGQKFDQTEVTYLVDRVTEKLENKYRKWQFNDFHVACEMGKMGHFQGATGMKITVRLIEQWLWHYNNIRMKRASEDQEREHIKVKNADLSVNPKSSIYAEAITWKLKRAAMFKAKGNWHDCPIKKVVEAYQDGTITELESLLFD